VTIMFVDHFHKRFNDRPGGGVQILLWFFSAHVATLTPFLRVGFGREYPGFPGLLAIPLLILAADETHDPGFAAFAAAWFGLLLVQKSLSWFHKLRTGDEHPTWSAGRPWLAQLLPFCRDEDVALKVEPFLCLMIGICVVPLFPGVGLWWMAGTVSLLVTKAIWRGIELRDSQFRRNLGVDQATAERRFRRFQKG